MKKIRITEAQLNMLREYQKGNTKTIKITESQLKMLEEAMGPLEKGIDTEIRKNKVKENVLTEGVEFLDFAQAVIQAIKFFFTDPGQNGLSPFWVKMGMSAGEVRSLIAGSGLITTVMAAGAEPTYKIVRKGFINLMKRLYNIFKEKRYDMKNKGKVIDKQASNINRNDVVSDKEKKGGLSRIKNFFSKLEEDNFPPGVNPGTQGAPWNDEEQGREDVYEAFQILKNFGDFTILVDESGRKYYLDNANFRHDIMDEDELSYQINLAVENGELKVDTDGQTLFQSDTISYLTPQNIQRLNSEADNPELEALLGDLQETTTTGSVGGSYETPKIWAKDPNNSRFGKTPMIKGGKMVKKRGKLSEIEKISAERYVVEMDMYLSGKDEQDVRLQIVEIENFINKRYDASVRTTSMKKLDFGKLGENTEIEGENLIK